MSTATPAVAATAAPAAGGASAPSKIPADIRRRAQGLTALTKEQQDEEKAKADKVVADAAAAKAADEKKLADEAKAKADAAAVGAPAVEKVKKVKSGPPLPEAPPADTRSVEEQVREAMEKDKRAGGAAGAPALAPEVQREVDLAAFAAKKHPDRYAGMADKIVGFYGARDTMLAEKAKELGGQGTGEFKDYLESDEFKEWVRLNRPTYQRGDVAKLQEDMIADRARTEARAEMAPELKALERKTAELEHAPDIRLRTDQALKIILADPNPEKDPALEGFAKDPMKFGEKYPEEAGLIATQAAEAVELIREVYRIDRDLVDFDPKRPTEKQVQINRFMVAQNGALREKHPNGIEMNDGKILVDAATYEKRGLRSDQRYRTFKADEIAGMIAAQRNAEVLTKLRQRREGVTKSVYAPKVAVTAGAQNGQQPAKADDAPPSPDAVVTRASGGKGKPAETKLHQAKQKYLNGK